MSACFTTLAVHVMSESSLKWGAIAVSVTALFASFDATAYEQAFGKTKVDQIEVRTLPASRMLASETQGSYFDHDNGLFKKLFNYISDNDISMTVPVEARLDRAEMRFYLGRDVPDTLDDTDSVRVVNVPSRQVVSIGGRGSYGESNVAQAKERLESWLVNQDKWAADGEPYAVFWDGPFTLWFMKRFEVHIPLRPTDMWPGG
ncbi:MAG: effector-binding domain-containing protein [Gammaproteobacteria bacterium]